MKKHQILLLSLALQAYCPLQAAHVSSNYLPETSEDNLATKGNNSLIPTPVVCSDGPSVLDPSGRYYTSPDGSWSPMTPLRWVAKHSLILGEKALVTTLSKGKTWSAQIQAKIRRGPEKVTLVHADGIYQVGDIPDDLLLAHRELRAPCSLATIRDNIDHYYERLMSTSMERVVLPTNDDLIHRLYSSALAAGIKVEAADKHLVDLRAIESIETAYGYFDITSAEINPLSKEITFISRHENSRKFTPADGRLYDFAKLSFLSGLIALAPLAHIQTHCDLPDVVGALAYNMENKESVLYKLLKRHTEFTLAVSSFTRGSAASAIRDGNNGLKSKLTQTACWTAKQSSFDVIGNTAIKVHNHSENATVFHCPPKVNTDLPYFSALMQYYPKIKQFVEDLSPFIKEDLKDFIGNPNGLSLYYPAVKAENFDPLEFLATFIWTVGIEHSAEHYTVYHALGSVPYDAARKTALKGGLVSASVCKMPLSGCTQSTTFEQFADQMFCAKTRNLLDLGVRFNHTPGVSFTMDHLDYDFGGIKGLTEKQKTTLELIQSEFQVGLNTVEKDLSESATLPCPLSETNHSIV